MLGIWFSWNNVLFEGIDTRGNPGEHILQHNTSLH